MEDQDGLWELQQLKINFEAKFLLSRSFISNMNIAVFLSSCLSSLEIQIYVGLFLLSLGCTVHQV